MVGSPETVPTLGRSIPPLNVPLVHDSFARVATRQAASFDVNTVYGNVPKACVIGVSTANVGVSENDIYVRPVTREVAHSIVMTPFEYRQDYGALAIRPRATKTAIRFISVCRRARKNCTRPRSIRSSSFSIAHAGRIDSSSHSTRLSCPKSGDNAQIHRPTLKTRLQALSQKKIGGGATLNQVTHTPQRQCQASSGALFEPSSYFLTMLSAIPAAIGTLKVSCL